MQNLREYLKTIDSEYWMLVRDDVNLTSLNYCIRTKHSQDMPLKHPRKNCAFLRGDECVWHPATAKYCKENDIDITYPLRFRCVLAEE